MGLPAQRPGLTPLGWRAGGSRRGANKGRFVLDPGCTLIKPHSHEDGFGGALSLPLHCTTAQTPSKLADLTRVP